MSESLPLIQVTETKAERYNCVTLACSAVDLSFYVETSRAVVYTGKYLI